MVQAELGLPPVSSYKDDSVNDPVSIAFDSVYILCESSSVRAAL